MTFDDLVNSLKSIPSGNTKQADGKYKVTKPSEGSETAVSDKAVNLALPQNNVSNGPDSTEKMPDLGPATQEIYRSADAAPDVTKVLQYGKTSGPSNFDFKSASDADIANKVAEQQKKAAELQKILEKVAANIPSDQNRGDKETNKSATDSNTTTFEEALGFPSKQAADEHARNVVASFVKRASEIADYLHNYNMGYAQADQYIQKIASNGELQSMMDHYYKQANPEMGMDPAMAGADPMAAGAAAGMDPAMAGGDPAAMGGDPMAGGDVNSEEMIEQALAALMEVTGMTPQQLEALLMDKLEQMGGGTGEGLGQDNAPEGGEMEGVEGAAGQLGAGGAMKVASAKTKKNDKMFKKLAGDLQLVRMLGDHAVKMKNKKVTEPTSKAAKAHREEARTYFADLRRSVA